MIEIPQTLALHKKEHYCQDKRYTNICIQNNYIFKIKTNVSPTRNHVQRWTPFSCHILVIVSNRYNNHIVGRPFHVVTTGMRR